MLFLLGLMEFICYGFVWILFTLTISTVTWIACGVRKPVNSVQTAPTLPAATNSKEQPKTAKEKEPAADTKPEKSVQFTPSQQAVIDAELKAALKAEKKDKEVKRAKLEREKTMETKEEPEPGEPQASVLKPISLGITKADRLVNPDDPKNRTPLGTPTASPANGKEGTAKDIKGSSKPRTHGTPGKSTPSKPGDTTKTAKHAGHLKGKEKTPFATTPRKAASPTPITPGKPSGAAMDTAKEKRPTANTPARKAPYANTPGRKGAADDGHHDGRSKYVVQTPNNLLMSAYAGKNK